MTRLTVTGAGSFTYAGPQTLDVIDFETTADATLKIDQTWVEASSGGGLDLALLGSPHDDAVSIRMTLGALDARGVAFGEGWGPADAILIRDRAGDDTIRGSSQRDTVTVTEGDDQVWGGAGLDTLVVRYGGTAGPHVTGTIGPSGGPLMAAILGSGGGSPTVAYAEVERLDGVFGDGADSIVGLAGDDLLRGGDGSDDLSGMAGSDRLDGEAGADRLSGQAGDDHLIGGDGADRLSGGGGADRLEGGRAGDDLGGGGGDDRLSGGKGADTVEGGAGRDVLSLGDDGTADTVVIGAALDSTSFGRDVVDGYDDADAMRLGTVVDALAFVNAASVSEATLNVDIANAVNGLMELGGPQEAVVVSATSGDLGGAGRSFLVVDGDNDGSYNAGPDYLIEFVNRTGAIGLDDFA